MTEKFKRGDGVKMSYVITNLPALISEASARIAESILVIWRMYLLFGEGQEEAQNYSIEFCRRLYNEALKRGAEDLEIQPTTLRDKLERQSKCRAETIIMLARDFFTKKDMNGLINVLMKSVEGTRKEAEDKRAISEFFKVLLCLENGIQVKCEQ